MTLIIIKITLIVINNNINLFLPLFIKYFLYTYYYKNMHVFIICDRYVFFQYLFTLTIIKICMLYHL